MSDNIDERIVEMQFNNKQFEEGVQTSVKSLDNLKKGLRLDESAKSLSNLERAGKSFSLANIAEGVDSIASKFTALGVIGFTALQNITNAAINAGMQITKALTIDPIKTGFTEYETQINAIQTILANTSSKGTTMDQVNAALDQLNKYADMTIYNFTQMTRNIGTFTAAGVDLDTSVAAIKGIANLAAVSGSNSQQASMAMYQLSQALASGTVKLIDWNSVVNAGMGGQVFQDSLKETARVHGVAIDKMIKKDGSFRETLQNGWLTSEILTETLSKFTGDLNADQLKTMGYTEDQIAAIIKLGQTATDAATKVKTFTQLFDTLKEAAGSGWAQSWEIIVGDFEEAKKLLTDVSNIFSGMLQASANARNSTLQAWKNVGGRTILIDALRNAFQALMNIINPIKEALRDIFPPLTTKNLLDFTIGLRDFTQKLKIGRETGDKLKRTFKGVFAVFDIVGQAIGALAKGFGKLIGYFAPAGEGILDVTAGIGDFLVGIRDSIKASDIFNKAVEGIGKFLKPIADRIRKIVGSIVEAVKQFFAIDTSGLDTFTEKMQAKLAPFKKVGEAISKVFDGISETFRRLRPFFEKVAKVTGEAFGVLKEKLIGVFEDFKFDNFFDLVNGGLLTAILVTITDFFKKGKGAFDGIKGILDGVKGALESWQSTLKADTLIKIATAIGVLTASLVVLSMIDKGKLTSSLGAMTGMFIVLFGAMAVLSKIMGGKGGKNMAKTSGVMVGMSIAILLLSTAMKKFAGMEWGDLAKGIVAIGAVIGLFSLLALSGGMAKKAFASTLLMGVVLSQIVVTFLILALLPTDKLLGAAAGLSMLLVALSSSMLMISMVPVAAAAQGIAGLAVVIGGLVAILAILGGLNQIPGFSWLMEEGTKVLQQVGNAIGAFGGAIVSGFMGGVSDAFPKIGANLGQFMTNAKPFLDGVKNLDASSIEGIKALAGAVLILTASDLLDGITKWLFGDTGSSFVDFGKELAAFAPYFVQFYNSISGIDGTVVQNSANAAKALAEFAEAIPKKGGVVGWFEGENSLSAFASELSVFGPILVSYANSVKGLDVVAVTAANEAASGIADMAANMPERGGVVGWFMGENSLSVIAQELLMFGPKLKAYANSVMGLNTKSIDISVTAAKSIAEMAGNLPDQGGVKGWFNGDNKLSTLAEELCIFGPKFKEYANIVGNLDVGAINRSTYAAKAIADFASALPNNGGLVTLFSGDNNLGKFGDYLAKFGNRFREYAGYMSKVDGNIVSKSASAGVVLKGLADSIPNNGGIISWFSGDNNIAVFGSQLADFGASFLRFFNNVKGIDTIKLSIVMTKIKDFIAMATGMTGVDLSGLTNFATALTTLGNMGVDGFLKSFNDSSVKVNAAITVMTDYLLKALDLKRPIIVMKATLLTTAMVGAINKQRPLFFAAGVNLANGFIAGLQSKVQAASKAGMSVANAALNAIQSIVNAGTDFTPTIRPVIDMSNVEKGTRKIGQEFGNRTINLATTTSRIAGIASDMKTNLNTSTPAAKAKQTPSLSFTQNNYSPKALSRVEIYRQTRNQFSKMKGLVTDS